MAECRGGTLLRMAEWSARWLNDILPYAVKCRYDILPCARFPGPATTQGIEWFSQLAGPQ